MIPYREEQDSSFQQENQLERENPELNFQFMMQKQQEQSQSQEYEILTVCFNSLRFSDQALIQQLPENMSQIYQLKLQWNKLSHKFLSYALLNFNLQNLKLLQLGQNNIGSLGIKFLVKISLPVLQQLFLSKCNIGDQGVRHLAKGNWPHLKTMTIWKNKININGLQNLNEHSWKSLKSLKTEQSCIGNFSHFLISTQGVSMIRIINQGEFDIYLEYSLSCVLSEQHDDILMIIFCNRQESQGN